MKVFNKITVSISIVLFSLVAANAVAGQDARLHFERLSGLEARARDVVEVNVDGKLLDLAKRVATKIKDKDGDAKKVAEAISGLKGIYVRVYNFERENEYNVSDVDQIRSQLNSPGWEMLANVRSKKNDQKVDIYTMFTGDVMSGVAVVISESKSIALVNVIGMIDIETLIDLSGKMNIPKIDVIRDSNTPKPKRDKE